jgi:hypothetical protein
VGLQRPGNKTFFHSRKIHMTTFRDRPLPAWVNWLAQDADGSWWGFEVEPNQSHLGWYENEIGRCQKLWQDGPNSAWQSSLVQVRHE